MTYSNTTELLDLLKKHHLWANKNLGQNFLVNPQVLTKIIEAAELQKEDEVVEVGPGLGILTAQLAQHAKKVTAIELDQRVIPILNEQLADFDNVEIQLDDALKTPLPTHEYKLVANIPYYITSPLLNHFLQPKAPQEKRPQLIVLLVQKEVAEKICAQTGDHTILSLQVQIFGQPKIVCSVNKSSFFPQPKIDSAVIKITTYPAPIISNTPLFFKIIKRAFAQRRKTLLNSLQNGFHLPKEKVTDLLEKAGIPPQTRPQALTIPQWQKLSNELEVCLPQ